MNEYKLSEKNAREQLELVLDFYDIDIDDIDNKTARQALKGAIKKLVKAIRKGFLEVKPDEDDVPVIIQHLRNNEILEYKEIEGKNKSEMKNADANDEYGKIYALVGSMTKIGLGGVKNVKGKDLSILECLGLLFLSV